MTLKHRGHLSTTRWQNAADPLGGAFRCSAWEWSEVKHTYTQTHGCTVGFPEMLPCVEGSVDHIGMINLKNQIQAPL